LHPEEELIDDENVCESANLSQKLHLSNILASNQRINKDV
jgi:hypothetical protein